MASDLTERLAAAITRTGKKITTTEVRNARWIQEVAPFILPLLLSEPELVAGLAPEVKRVVLALLSKWHDGEQAKRLAASRAADLAETNETRRRHGLPPIAPSEVR